MLLHAATKCKEQVSWITKGNVSINSLVLLKNCVEVNPSTYFNFIDRTRTICTSLPQSLPQCIHDFHLCLPIDHRMHFLRVLFMKHIFYCSKSLTHYYSNKGSNFTCCCHNPFYVMVEWYNVYLATNIHFFFTTKKTELKRSVKYV